MTASLTLITTKTSKLSASIAIGANNNEIVGNSDSLKSKLSKSKNPKQLSKPN